MAQVKNQKRNGAEFSHIGGSMENYNDDCKVKDSVTGKMVKEPLNVLRVDTSTGTAVKRMRYGSSREERVVELDENGNPKLDADGNEIVTVYPAVEGVVVLVRMDFSGLGSFTGKYADTLLTLAVDGYLPYAKKHIDRVWKYDGNRNTRRFDIRVKMSDFSRESTPEEVLLDAAFEIASKSGKKVSAVDIMAAVQGALNGK